jgi:hypothetical protein
MDADVTSILMEVHGTGWSPTRWMPLVFPSSLSYDPGDSTAAYVIDTTATNYIRHAPPSWRDILARITCFAESNPLGLQVCFTAQHLQHLDGFLALFSALPKCPAWLHDVIRRLHLLRRAFPPPPASILPDVPITAPPLLPDLDVDQATMPSAIFAPNAPPTALIPTQGARNARYLMARHERAFGFARGLPADFSSPSPKR